MDKMKSIKEVAEIFKVSGVTVRNWIASRDIPIQTRQKIGERPIKMVNIEDIEKSFNCTVEEYLKQQEEAKEYHVEDASIKC